MPWIQGPPAREEMAFGVKSLRFFWKQNQNQTAIATIIKNRKKKKKVGRTLSKEECFSFLQCKPDPKTLQVILRIPFSMDKVVAISKARSQWGSQSTFLAVLTSLIPTLCFESLQTLLKMHIQSPTWSEPVILMSQLLCFLKATSLSNLSI